MTTSRRIPLARIVEVFAFDYPVLFGPRLVWASAWRRRLVRNIPDIVALGDAFDVGSALPRPSPTVQAHLSRPIHHYRAVCPCNYVEKLRSVAPRTPVWEAELRVAEAALHAAQRAGGSVQEFWERVPADLEASCRKRLQDPGAPPVCVSTTDHVPSVMREPLKRWQYSLDESLAALQAASSA